MRENQRKRIKEKDEREGSHEKVWRPTPSSAPFISIHANETRGPGEQHLLLQRYANEEETPPRRGELEEA